MNVGKSKFPKRGEIWVVDYNFKFSDLCPGEEDFTVESSIKKNRPCIVISSNINNEFSDLIIAIPLTSKSTMEVEKPIEVLVRADQLNNLSKDSKALITFLSHFNKNSRLKKLIGFVREEVMKDIVKKINKLIS